MICSIDNETIRLKIRSSSPEFCPFVVTIFLTDKSRKPVTVRRKTLKEAQIFVEEVTGVDAHLWVHNGTLHDGEPATIYSFTEKHSKRYSDTAQYKGVDLDAFSQVRTN